jgi:hypothetical protein
MASVGRRDALARSMPEVRSFSGAFSRPPLHGVVVNKTPKHHRSAQRLPAKPAGTQRREDAKLDVMKDGIERIINALPEVNLGVLASWRAQPIQV